MAGWGGVPEKVGDPGAPRADPICTFRLPKPRGGPRREQPGIHLILSVLSPAPLCVRCQAPRGGPGRVSMLAPFPPRVGWCVQAPLGPSGGGEPS